MKHKKKLVQDFSASTVQMVLSQVSGAVIFYLLFRYLDKPLIGHISWSLAVLMLLFTVLGFGLDQLTVKKIATGIDPAEALGSYFFHVLVTGCAVGFLLFLGYILYFHGNPVYSIFVWLSFSQCLLYFSLPFKQLANGKEQFRALMFMSVTANMIRVAGLPVFILLHALTIHNILLLYVCSSLIELLVCLYYYARQLGLPVHISWNRQQYRQLLREALPQLGIVVCNTLISRVDWVLLGLMGSATLVAEYGFAYKFFELSTLPLLIIGPLLLPKVAKMFSKQKNAEVLNNQGLFNILQMELTLAVFIGLLVNICWTPLISFVTDGKYGINDTNITFILSVAAPLLYANNIFWSVSFAEEKLKSIFFIFLVTCLVNIIADLILIPLYQSDGAAAGYLLAIIVQHLLYWKESSLAGYGKVFKHFLFLLSCALVAWYVATRTFDNLWMQLITAFFGYTILLVCVKQADLSRRFFPAKTASI